MGGCAGCMGPNRRSENYRVNRLTENSPIKSRVSTSELPLSRKNDRIIQEINESKRKYEQNNLISTLITPSANIEKPYRDSKLFKTALDPPEIYGRESHEIDVRGSGMIRLRKVESRNNLDENSFEKERSPFISEFRTSEPLGQLNNKVLSQIRLNKNSQFSLKKGLSNIPELIDEDSKTPVYVKKIRKENGEDVKRTNLDAVPKALLAAPKLSLFEYLKDLS